MALIKHLRRPGIEEVLSLLYLTECSQLHDAGIVIPSLDKCAWEHRTRVQTQACGPTRGQRAANCYFGGFRGRHKLKGTSGEPHPAAGGAEPRPPRLSPAALWHKMDGESWPILPRAQGRESNFSSQSLKLLEQKKIIKRSAVPNRGDCGRSVCKDPGCVELQRLRHHPSHLTGQGPRDAGHSWVLSQEANVLPEAKYKHPPTSPGKA